MSLYIIGDIQGCYDPLSRLLDTLRFDPANDALWLVGDLVNRGGQSLQVLRLLHSIRHRVTSVLGNHDLHLLAQAERFEQRPTTNQEFLSIFEAHDGHDLLTWMNGFPLMQVDHERRFVMVHAGIPPEWNLKRCLKLSRRVEEVLRGKQRRKLLKTMYGDYSAPWQPRMPWINEMRTIINAFTRMRYRDSSGQLSFQDKGPPGTQQKGFQPWFVYPRKLGDYTILFGHWSSLGIYFGYQTMCLDSGCVWGGPLTAIRLGEDFEIIQVTGRKTKTSSTKK